METTLRVQLGIITTADSVTVFHRQFSLSSVNVDSDVLQNMVQIPWTKNLSAHGPQNNIYYAWQVCESRQVYPVCMSTTKKCVIIKGLRTGRVTGSIQRR